MLRVTVELWPAGSESSRRVIATAAIGRIADGALADYEVSLSESGIGAVGKGTSVRIHDGLPQFGTSFLAALRLCLVAMWSGCRSCRRYRRFLCTQRLMALATSACARSRSTRGLILSADWKAVPTRSLRMTQNLGAVPTGTTWSVSKGVAMLLVHDVFWAL